MTHGAFTLPAHFLTTVQIHGRPLYETGGFLLARRAAPHEVVVATGPPPGTDHGPDFVALERRGVDEAVGAAGLTVVGDWHTHPQEFSPKVSLTPSPDDHEAWRAELRKSPGVDTFFGVVVLRKRGRTDSMAAFATDRSGACKPVVLPGITESTRELARSLAYGIEHGPLIKPPARWDPVAIRRELERIEVDKEAHEAVRLHDLNVRLRRLGYAEIQPLCKPKPKPKREVNVPTSQQPRIGPAPQRFRFGEDEIRDRLCRAIDSGIDGAVEKEIEHMKAMEGRGGLKTFAAAHGIR